MQTLLFPGAKTYAAHPVWKGSVRGHIKFQPMPKKQAVRLFHEARRFEGATREPGKQDGKLGRNGILVLHTLVFDFLNYASGRLDPSYASIARRANMSVRSVALGLSKLKAAGILNWVRRVRLSNKHDGLLEQDSNAYAVLGTAQWKGWIPMPPCPPPQPGTWGDHPPMPVGLDAFAAAVKDGLGMNARIAALESDPGDALALTLARASRRRVTSMQP